MLLGAVKILVVLNGNSLAREGTLSIHWSPMADESQGRLDDIESGDNRFINSALQTQNRAIDSQVILVTEDINMRLKALGAGLGAVEDYRRDQLVSDLELLPSGYLGFVSEFWIMVGNVETWDEREQNLSSGAV